MRRHAPWRRPGVARHRGLPEKWREIGTGDGSIRLCIASPPVRRAGAAGPCGKAHRRPALRDLGQCRAVAARGQAGPHCRRRPCRPAGARLRPLCRLEPIPAPTAHPRRDARRTVRAQRTVSPVPKQIMVESMDRAGGGSKSGALFWIGFASAASITVGPLIVGGLIEGYHYSPRDAGFVAGIETLGVGLGSFLVSSMGARWSRRATISYGTLLAILGSLTPLVAHHEAAVLVFRGLAGLGCGMTAAAVIAAIAQMHRPDRQFGLYFVFSYLLNALYFPASQGVMTTFGFASMCYF